MASSIAPFQISAPGFKGLNLQDSPIGMDPDYALDATNCVIDQSGRIAARKGWTKVSDTTPIAALGTSNITCMGEVIEHSGTKTYVFTAGAKLFKMDAGLVTELTYGGGGAAPTILAANWKFCQMTGIGIFWQRGYDPLIYDPAVSITTYRRLSEKTGAVNFASVANGAMYQTNEAISAYGHIWQADLSTDKNTVVWSALATPHIYNGATAGSLNLHNVWPKGGDEIVGLAAHNNFLIIFGKKQTLIYNGTSAPSTALTLADTLEVGCIARDSIQVTGDDVIFLSHLGVTSLMRTIQEKSIPLRVLSRNVNDEFNSYVSLENMNNIKAIYSPVHGFYLITFPANGLTYCLDVKRLAADGSARVTKWNNIKPQSFLFTADRLLFLGQAGYVGKYSEFLDNGVTYRVSYYTPWIDFGSPIQRSILKKILLTVVGGAGSSLVFKWAFDFNTTYTSQAMSIASANSLSEYGIAEYGTNGKASPSVSVASEYLAGVGTQLFTVSGSGSGNVIQFGFESNISNHQLSFQKLDIHTKDGRL